jgi:hypothetical protein
LNKKKQKKHMWLAIEQKKTPHAQEKDKEKRWAKKNIHACNRSRA